MYLRLHDIYLLAASSSALMLTGWALSSPSDQNRIGRSAPHTRDLLRLSTKGSKQLRIYRLASKSSPSLSSPNHDKHYHGRDWINCGLSSGYILNAST